MSAAGRPDEDGKEVRNYGNFPNRLPALAEELLRYGRTPPEVFEALIADQTATLFVRPEWDPLPDKKVRKIVMEAQRATATSEGIEAARALNSTTRKPADEGEADFPGVTRALQIKRANREAERRLAEEDATANPLPPVDYGTLDEMLGRDEAAKWRINDFLPADGRLLLTAQRKAGKTTLVGNLARALLGGSDFLGRYSVAPIEGSVMILNYEVSGPTLAAWLDDMGFDDEQRRRLVIVNLRGRENLLASDAGRAKLVEMMRSTGTAFLIVDVFGRAFTGEQNSNSEVASWLGMLDRVATDGGAQELALVAHAGWTKDGSTTRSRGASALEDWPDVIATLALDGDLDAPRYLDAFGRDVSIERARLDFDAETRLLTYTGQTKRATDRAKKSATLADPILEVVRETPGISSGDILPRLRRIEGLSFQKGDDKLAVDDLVGRGLIARIKDGRMWRHYPPDLIPPRFKDQLEDPTPPKRKA